MPGTIFSIIRTVHDGQWPYAAGDLVQYVPLPLDDKREYHTVAGLFPMTVEEIDARHDIQHHQDGS